MHLIILYGPPASGKLTIAKTLAKQTRFSLLHNHLIADFAHTFFEYGTDAYVHFATQLRETAIDAALSAKLPGLIMTFAFGLETKEGKRDESLLKTITARIKRGGGTVTLVRLVCDEPTLLKRVSSADRKKFHKLIKPSVLKHILKTYNINQPVTFTESLTIDTAKMTPKQAVRTILKTGIYS